MKISHPTPDSWNDIQELYLRSFDKIYPAFLEPDFAALITEKPAAWVADEAGKTVGFATVSLRTNKENEWLLRTLFVAPEYRNRGLGSALLKQAEQFIKDQGGKIITLGPFAEPYFSLGVALDSGEFDFFTKQGFSEIGDIGARPVWMNIELNNWQPPERYNEIVKKLTAADIALRTTTADDRKALLKMTDREFSGWHNSWFKPNEALENPAPTIVAVAGNQVAGFTGTLRVERGEFGQLDCVGVANDFRRKGIALATVTKACDWWQKNGAQRGYLWTSIGNPAIKLYQEVGFEIFETYATISKEL